MASPVRLRLYDGFAWLLALAALANLALAVSGRVAFRWPLEWMEGAVSQQGLALLEGRPLYAPPTAEFVALLYPPLAYVPVAGAIATFGPTLPAARLPSVLAAVGCLLLIGHLAARVAGRSAAGALAIALFAMGYGYAGAFLDLARVDAVFLLLAVAGAERLQAGRPTVGLALLALSIFAKQHGLWLLLAASAHVLVFDRTHWRAVALVWLGVAVGEGYLELTTGGWYGRYVWALPAKHGVLWPLFFSFFAVDLLVYLPLPTLVAATAVWRRSRARAPDVLDAVLAAALVASALGRAHVGGHDNVRLPALAFLAVVGMVPVATVLCDATRTLRLRVAAGVATLVQLAILWQPPSLHRPTHADAEGFERLVAAARACGTTSPVMLDYALPGQRPFMHSMALSDLLLAGDTPLSRAGVAALLERLRGESAPPVLVVGERFDALDTVLARRYVECARVPAPMLVTGHRAGRDGEQVVYRLAP